MKGDLHQVLIQPLLTEKITALREQSNTVGFLVHPDANKIQIKQAVESLLKVKVSRVNVVNIRGKIKRLGRFVGKRSDWKKAFEEGICHVERGREARAVRNRLSASLSIE